MNKLSSPMLIAEIGNNHEGNFKNAKKLVFQAYKAKADCVKFQCYNLKNFIHPSQKKSFKNLQNFNLSNHEFVKLARYAKKLKLKFCITPLDLDSLNSLAKYCDFFKIASGDNNFYLLIEEMFKFNKDIIISTGATDLKGIIKIKNFIKKKYHLNKITFLHCVSSYPAKTKDLNLAAIKLMKKKLNVKIGYSDHHEGVIASLIAINLGAEVIEKHFTLSKNFSSFRDHKLSADLYDLNIISQYLHNQYQYIGKPKKIITQDEKKILFKIRRSIYAKNNILKGETINKDMLLFLRPQNNISVDEINNVLGKKTNQNIPKNQPIKKNYLI
jgi:N,N'-diacetyllegionaminate synthase